MARRAPTEPSGRRPGKGKPDVNAASNEARRILRTTQDALDHESSLVRDQTEKLRQLTHESRWKNAVLFDLAPIGYAVVDHNGRIDAVNLSLSVLLGKPRSHLTSVPLTLLISPDDRAIFLQHLQRCRASDGEAVSTSLRMIRSRSDVFPVSLISRRIRGFHAPLFLSAVIDMSERVTIERALTATEDKLREMNSELQRRTVVAERAAAQLRMLASQLNLAEQRERRRIASLLHDHLQQFLVSAKIHLKLSGRAGGENLEKLLHRVDGLIDQAIQASRTLTMELSPPVLHDAGLAAALSWLVRWMGDKHHLRVELDADIPVEPSDAPLKTFIFEAVREMLLNVVKHSGVNRAEVRARRVHDLIEIVVRDQGAGFDAAAVQSAEQGEHVGLVTLRERVRLLGGMLEVFSAPGKGTTVQLSCPVPESQKPMETLRPAAVAPVPGASPDPSWNGGVRVLIVDDHQFLREGLIRILESEEGISVVGEAADGREAVLMAREVSPDVVIMDVTLPELSGIEATRLIRKERPSVRVIALSMHDRKDMEEGMLAAGASAYLTKGGPVEQLVQTIRQTNSIAPELTNPKS
jgi:PAS domain S-box-containing protein